MGLLGLCLLVMSLLLRLELSLPLCRQERCLLVVHRLSLLLSAQVQAMGGHPLLNHLRRCILSRSSLHVAQVLLQRLHLLWIELGGESLRLWCAAWPLWLLLTRRHDDDDGKAEGKSDEATTL